MKSSVISPGVATIGQYNDLREDARASSYLKVRQADVPDMSVVIDEGVFTNVDDGVVSVAGSTKTFVAPVTNPRIDVISVSGAGVVTVTTGVENASPAIPDTPVDHLKLAEITLSVGMTEVEDADIQDARGGLKVQPVIIATPISDIAYDATTWLNNTDGATKNSIRNKVETIGAVKVGSTTRDISVTGVQNIAHGLGTTPKRARVRVFWDGTTVSSGYAIYCDVTHNGTTTIGEKVDLEWSTGIKRMRTTTQISLGDIGGNNYIATASISFNATNLILNWGKSNSPTGTYTIVWEVQ